MATRIRRLAPLLLLAGCAVGPDFEAPSPWSPSSWFRAAPAKPAPVASLPVAEPVDPDWWVAFNDPVLTGLMRRVRRLEPRRAGRGHSAGRIARATRGDRGRAVPHAERQRQLHAREAQQQRRHQRLFRRCGRRHRHRRSRRPGQQRPGRAHRRLPVHVQDPAVRPVPGRLRRELGARPVGPRAPGGGECGCEHRRVGGGAAADAGHQPGRARARLPCSCAARRSSCASRGRNLATARDSVYLTSQRAKGGLATDLDVANAAAQLELTAATIPQFEQSEAQQINAISLLLGAPPGALAAELNPDKPIPPVPPRVPVGIPSELGPAAAGHPPGGGAVARGDGRHRGGGGRFLPAHHAFPAPSRCRRRSSRTSRTCRAAPTGSGPASPSRSSRAGG